MEFHRVNFILISKKEAVLFRQPPIMVFLALSIAVLTRFNNLYRLSGSILEIGYLNINPWTKCRKLSLHFYTSDAVIFNFLNATVTYY